MIERTQKFTDGILIFVSSHVISQMTPRQLGNIEWFIRCYRWCTAYNLNPRSQAELARHLRILPTEHLSASIFWQPKCFSSIDPIYFGQTTRILSAEICHLGELTLVFEFGFQSFLCHICDDDSELGSSLHRGHLVAMGYTIEASADPYLFY